MIEKQMVYLLMNDIWYDTSICLGVYSSPEKARDKLDEQSMSSYKRQSLSDWEIAEGFIDLWHSQKEHQSLYIKSYMVQ